MRLIECDLHGSQQSMAMLDRDTGAVIEKTLKHEGEAVREFYASIPPPVRRRDRSDGVDGMAPPVDGEWTSKNCGDNATAASADSVADESRLRRPARRTCVLTWPTSLELSRPSSEKRARICAMWAA